jgi:indole-3-glycerol phosphate synthase
MDQLAEITAHKRIEVEPLHAVVDKLKTAALLRNDFAGFRAALDRGPNQLGVIAEVKKASPSAGIIDPNFDPLKQANIYIEGKASCMSILTDQKYFQGSLSDLTSISKESPIPLLRKDFTVHEAQIYESVISGADAILLIVACLSADELHKFYQIARDLQLDVLVEVHDLPEMERAIDLGADLIGINNRNLKTFKTDLATTEKLAEEAPDHVILVSESGIKNVEDAQRVLNAGANAILVGEALMRANVPGDEVQAFLDLTAMDPAEDPPSEP